MRISDLRAITWELLQSLMVTRWDSLETRKNRGVRLEIDGNLNLGRGIRDIIAFEGEMTQRQIDSIPMHFAPNQAPKLTN